MATEHCDAEKYKKLHMCISKSVIQAQDFDEDESLQFAVRTLPAEVLK